MFLLKMKIYLIFVIFVNFVYLSNTAKLPLSQNSPQINHNQSVPNDRLENDANKSLQNDTDFQDFVKTVFESYEKDQPIEKPVLKQNLGVNSQISQTVIKMAPRVIRQNPAQNQRILRSPQFGNPVIAAFPNVLNSRPRVIQSYPNNKIFLRSGPVIPVQPAPADIFSPQNFQYNDLAYTAPLVLSPMRRPHRRHKKRRHRKKKRKHHKIHKSKIPEEDEYLVKASEKPKFKARQKISQKSANRIEGRGLDPEEQDVIKPKDYSQEQIKPKIIKPKGQLEDNELEQKPGDNEPEVIKQDIETEIIKPDENKPEVIKPTESPKHGKPSPKSEIDASVDVSSKNPEKEQEIEQKEEATNVTNSEDAATETTFFYKHFGGFPMNSYNSYVPNYPCGQCGSFGPYGGMCDCGGPFSYYMPQSPFGPFGANCWGPHHWPPHNHPHNWYPDDWHPHEFYPHDWDPSDFTPHGESFNKKAN